MNKPTEPRWSADPDVRDEQVALYQRQLKEYEAACTIEGTARAVERMTDEYDDEEQTK